MNTFDRHLLREWLGILALVLVAMLGFFLFQICFDELRSMLDAGAHLGEVLRYLGVTLPSYGAIILPLGLLFSLLYTLTKLHRANELTAMRAAGVGILRITAPVWFVGALVCALVWWLNASVVPWSVERSRDIAAQLRNRREARTLPPDWVGATTDVAFDEPEAGRLWFFNRLSAANGHGYGVSVTELGERHRPADQILAAEAWRDPVRGGWVFRDGRLLSFDSDSGEAVKNAPFHEQFEPGFQEDPTFMLIMKKRPVDLSFFELRRVMRYYDVENPAKAVPFATRYYSFLADTLGPLIVIAIAIPFAVTGVRTNPVVGVSKSIGLFFLYWILTAVAGTLASKGWIEPASAAWLPNGGMIALAVWFLARMR